jgi:uncharacterized protein (DUF4415 family)
MRAKKHVSKTDFAKLDASEGIPDDDIPELTEEMLDRATLRIGGVVIRAPRTRGRPLGSGKKEPIKVRIDKDILAHFRATGRGWQTRLNDTLRASLRGKPGGAKSKRAG